MADGFEKISQFSEVTQRLYTLRPTQTWPALEISGVLMHRIKGTDPKEDAEAKIALISPVRGAVLDTCCGLGYLAILEAKTAESVTTIEKDEMVLEMARLNPYSREIFENPRINLVCGDSAELIRRFGDAAFDIVSHDPPTLSLAGELYSDVFYEQLFRVLKPGGKLLHYTGTPGSRRRRIDIPGSVARRLKKIGFAKVESDKATSCITAKRPGRLKSRRF
ncbi:MAG: methyltransferase domain-containing protein [Planctomycetota bacterium]|nr:methyltransferase domain-containing protein [Planctomycetota bacterium]